MIEIKRLYLKTNIPDMYVIEKHDGSFFAFFPNLDRIVTEDDLFAFRDFNGEEYPYETKFAVSWAVCCLFELDDTGGAVEGERIPAWDEDAESRKKVWETIDECRITGEKWNELITYSKGNPGEAKSFTETLCTAKGVYFLLCNGGTETKYEPDIESGVCWERPLTKNGAYKYISDRFGEDTASKIIK